jgi:hypothetical protein
MAERTLLGHPSQQNQLIEANIEDTLASFGLDHLRFGRGLLEALCWLPARGFARQMADFDSRVGEEGLLPASQRTLQAYASHLEIAGQENIPTSGPLLVLSNHPGMTDTLSLFSSLPRTDLRIIASERPFLDALSNVSRHLIYVPDDANRRMGVVRSVTSHLRSGGAVLTFPAGEIEPDPACMPGAIESLQSWSESIAVFARLVPATQIVIAVVSGVIWPASLSHPLTHLRRERKARERIAATLQVLTQTLQPSRRLVAPRVAFSSPLSASKLASNGPQALMETITRQAQRLIREAQTAQKVLETSGD